MALESATFLASLVAANPASSDAASVGDDHLRLIKSVLLNTFPNLAGEVSATHNQLNAYVPTGGVIMWTGSTASIPSGWGLADGSSYAKLDGSGTLISPDLRNRFIVGAGDTYAVGASGGSNADKTVTSSTLAAVDLSSDTAAGGDHSHGGATGGHALTVDELAVHNHDLAGSYSAEDNNMSSGSTRPLRESSGSVGTFTNSTEVQNAGGGEEHTHPISASGTHVHAFSATVPEHDHEVVVATIPAYYALAYIIRL